MWDALIIRPFINVVLIIYNLVGNFGVAIILFTILIRLITHPLMARQIKSAKAMQELQNNKKWQAIQKKYENDKEKLAQEQMKLYRELGVSPFSSCLPTLIQFPIIIGLYQSIIRTLASTPIELLNMLKQLYPGLFNVAELIPLNSSFLWMELGQPERLNLDFLPFGIPVLTIVVVTTTFLQSRLMQGNTASDGNDQAAAMARSMNLTMPVMMGFMAYQLASGLALYFVTSNLVGILQYTFLGRLDWKNLFSRDPEKK